jgi:predicted lipid-binding transport protein (Tim44 family)
MRFQRYLLAFACQMSLEPAGSLSLTKGFPMKRSFMLAAVAGTSLLFPLGAMAQEATPATPAAAIDACEVVVPRDAEMLRTLAATPPAPSAGTPEASTPVADTAEASPFAMPEGDPASAEDVAAVTQVYETLVSCLSAGDFQRISALYTDDYLQRNFTSEAIANLDVTPEADAAVTETTLAAVDEVRVLGEDRLGALVTTRTEQSGDVTTYVELVRSGDALLIDYEEVIDSGAATPTS